MSTNLKIQELFQNFLLEKMSFNLNDKIELNQKIELLYNDIISELASNYELINKHVWELIDVTDMHEGSINLIVALYINLYKDVSASKTRQVSVNPIQAPFNFNEVYPLFVQLSEQVVVNDPFRLSGDYIDLREYDTNTLTDIYKCTIKQIISTLNINDLDNSMYNTIGLMYVVARNIANKIDYIENYYLHIASYIDYLNRAENKQLARDTSNEILLSSNKDNLLEYGCYIFFRNFIEQRRIGAALIFGSICLKTIYDNRNKIDEDFLFNITWQTLKLLVHERKVSIALNFYNDIPKDMFSIKSQRFRLDYCFFTCQYLINEEKLMLNLFSYFEQYVNEIFNDDLVPWLILMYNIDSLEYYHSKGSPFNISELKKYILLFESKIPENFYNKQKSIIYGETNSLKKYFVEAYMRVKEGRHKVNFPYDINSVVDLASRLVKDSYLRKDFDGFLMAMMVKADDSLFQIDKPNNMLEEAKVNNYNLDQFLETQITRDTLQEYIIDGNIIWLAQSDYNIYELALTKTNLEFYILNEWDLEISRRWITDQLPNFLFDDYIKIQNRTSGKNEVRRKLPEEHIQYTDKVKNELHFSTINTNESNSILLVKDMFLSQFPHNLLLDEANEFISLKAPITDIISINWFVEKCISNKHLISDYTVSLWIPTEAGDFTLNHLYDKLLESGAEERYNINIDTSVNNMDTLCSNINLVAAHGDLSISSIPALFINDNTFGIVSNDLIKTGDILILLVCHSGSMKQSKLKSQIDSFVRKYLFREYQCVIAPFWALHIDIPPIWLPEFLDGLNAGLAVSEAVFLANLKVCEFFPNPQAWGCMHLYGNPYFKKYL